MSLISFDLSISPDPAAVDMQVALTAAGATLSLSQPVSLSISAKPSTGTIVGGAIVGSVLGGFVGGGLTVGGVYAAAAAIGRGLTDKVNGAINDVFPHAIRFTSPIGYTFDDVEGVSVRVEADTLALSTFNGMLMVEGTAKIMEPA